MAEVYDAPDVKGLREYAEPPAALIGTPPLIARICVPIALGSPTLTGA